VDAIAPELGRKRISFDDFLRFHRMQRKLHTLSVALDFFHHIDRPVSKSDFAKMVKKLLGIALGAHVIEVIFAVFGDEAGMLNTPAFLEVMQRREIMWARRKQSEIDTYQPGTVARAMVCVRKCFSDD
ncbi:hypothetical protein TSOC_006539, partial [Tetrabaena socialis]